MVKTTNSFKSPNRMEKLSIGSFLAKRNLLDSAECADGCDNANSSGDGGCSPTVVYHEKSESTTATILTAVNSLVAQEMSQKTMSQNAKMSQQIQLQSQTITDSHTQSTEGQNDPLISPNSAVFDGNSLNLPPRWVVNDYNALHKSSLRNLFGIGKLIEAVVPLAHSLFLLAAQRAATEHRMVDTPANVVSNVPNDCQLDQIQKLTLLITDGMILPRRHYIQSDGAWLVSHEMKRTPEGSVLPLGISLSRFSPVIFILAAVQRRVQNYKILSTMVVNLTRCVVSLGLIVIAALNHLGGYQSSVFNVIRHLNKNRMLSVGNNVDMLFGGEQHNSRIPSGCLSADFGLPPLSEGTDMKMQTIMYHHGLLESPISFIVAAYGHDYVFVSMIAGVNNFFRRYMGLPPNNEFTGARTNYKASIPIRMVVDHNAHCWLVAARGSKYACLSGSAEDGKVISKMPVPWDQSVTCPNFLVREVTKRDASAYAASFIKGAFVQEDPERDPLYTPTSLSTLLKYVIVQSRHYIRRVTRQTLVFAINVSWTALMLLVTKVGSSYNDSKDAEVVNKNDVQTHEDNQHVRMMKVRSRRTTRRLSKATTTTTTTDTTTTYVLPEIIPTVPLLSKLFAKIFAMKASVSSFLSSPRTHISRLWLSIGKYSPLQTSKRRFLRLVSQSNFTFNKELTDDAAVYYSYIVDCSKRQRLEREAVCVGVDKRGTSQATQAGLKGYIAHVCKHVSVDADGSIFFDVEDHPLSPLLEASIVRAIEERGYNSPNTVSVPLNYSIASLAFKLATDTVEEEDVPIAVCFSQGGAIMSQFAAHYPKRAFKSMHLLGFPMHIRIASSLPVRVFITTALSFFPFLLLCVDLIQSLLPPIMTHVPRFFVKDCLNFSLRPLKRSISELVYKFIPCGGTSTTNLGRWASMFDPNGAGALTNSWTVNKIYAKGVEKLHYYFASDDSLVDVPKSIEQLSELPHIITFSEPNGVPSAVHIRDHVNGHSSRSIIRSRSDERSSSKSSRMNYFISDRVSRDASESERVLVSRGQVYDAEACDVPSPVSLGHIETAISLPVSDPTIVDITVTREMSHCDFLWNYSEVPYLHAKIVGDMLRSARAG